MINPMSPDETADDALDGFFGDGSGESSGDVSDSAVDSSDDSGKGDKESREFHEAKAWMDLNEGDVVSPAEEPGVAEVPAEILDVSHEGSGSNGGVVTDDDIAGVESLLRSMGEEPRDDGAAQPAEVGARIEDESAAEEVVGEGFSALDFLEGGEGAFATAPEPAAGERRSVAVHLSAEEAREVLGDALLNDVDKVPNVVAPGAAAPVGEEAESGEELIELDVGEYQGKSPKESAAASDDGAGLFDDGALLGEAEAEHAGIVAAGNRLEAIARGDSPLKDVSFDDMEDALAQPLNVDAEGNAIAPISPAKGESGEETEKHERVLGDVDKTELELRPLARRVASAKKAGDSDKESRVGEETGDFTDDAEVSGKDVTPADLKLGDEIAGTYIIKKRLSAGGMGALYAAYDKNLDRDVAIKVILNNGTPLTEEQVERFRAEAQAMARVAHENLAQVYDARTWRGTPYLVMELCQGGDLLRQMRERGVPTSKREQTTKTKIGSSSKSVIGSHLVEAFRATARNMTRRLRNRPLEEIAREVEAPVVAEDQNVPVDPSWTLQTHASLIKKLAGALKMVHEKGVVHRDLKPANVMYADADRTRPVVIDFGLVPVKNEQKGAVLGTPSYMSPEQALADPALDFRTDVYSLGAVFYELVTGHIPYQELSKPRNPVEAINRIIRDPLTPPLQLNKAVDHELSAIIEKMLAKELLMNRAEIQARVLAELVQKGGFESMPEEDKKLFLKRRFKEEYEQEYALRKKDAEGTYYRYESMDEVIADIERYEKGLPVLAFTYTDAERKAKELKYWEKTNPEEARLKREEEERARKWQRNARLAGVGFAALVLAWAGNWTNEKIYSRNARLIVNDTHTSVTSLADRARRDGVARIGTDLAATIARVSSAESLVSEWVVRQRTADAAQGQVQVQEDRRVVDALQDSVRKYNDARALLEEYRRARGDSDFARAYQSVFSAYQLSREAVAQEAGASGLDDVRARALVDEVERLRDDAIGRRRDYARERIEAYEARLKALYKARFLRQLPGGSDEFAREYERARSDLARELNSPPAVDLQRVAVTPEMRSNWSRLEREAVRGAEELEAELRSVPGLEQGIILGARADQHRTWIEYVNTVQRRLNSDDARQFFDRIRGDYRALRQDASLSDDAYLREGAALQERVSAYEQGALGPKSGAEAPKRR